MEKLVKGDAAGPLFEHGLGQTTQQHGVVGLRQGLVGKKLRRVDQPDFPLSAAVDRDERLLSRSCPHLGRLTGPFDEPAASLQPQRLVTDEHALRPLPIERAYHQTNAEVAGKVRVVIGQQQSAARPHPGVQHGSIPGSCPGEQRPRAVSAAARRERLTG